MRKSYIYTKYCLEYFFAEHMINTGHSCLDIQWIPILPLYVLQFSEYKSFKFSKNWKRIKFPIGDADIHWLLKKQLLKTILSIYLCSHFVFTVPTVVFNLLIKNCDNKLKWVDYHPIWLVGGLIRSQIQIFYIWTLRLFH